ncbi:hypothetical protein [Streptomyces cyaneofuscatus]|uniref:hypothetical protein n=1 Tax=Streptomyces cyaneofuscatus TaxID=66883 RepID=UPI0036525F61
MVLDLRTEEAECAAGLFPLHLVFDAQRVSQWKKGYIKADEERNWDRWGQFDDLVLQQVRAFQVPMIRLAASTSMDAVCAVFERVNTGGVPLNVFELNRPVITTSFPRCGGRSSRRWRRSTRSSAGWTAAWRTA